MTKYNKNGFSYRIDGIDIQKDIEQKRIQYEKIIHETQKWMKETEDSWLDKQISLFFSNDFDLSWAYDCFKTDKDWRSLKTLLEDHNLRIVNQWGRMVNESYLTHLFCGSKLLGTLEIKIPNGTNSWSYQVISK